MERTDNIPDDFENLERYAPTLHKIARVNPFSVPSGYFESLSEILSTVAVIAKASNYKKTNDIPEGYFDKLPSFIQSQAVLSDIKKENPFAVPANYFDYLPARIQERIQQTSKNENWLTGLIGKLISPRLAFALPIALIVVAAGFFLLRNPIDNMNSDKQLSELSNKDLSETANEFDESYLIDEITEGGIVTDAASSEDTDDIADYLIDNKVDVNVLLNEM